MRFSLKKYTLQPGNPSLLTCVTLISLSCLLAGCGGGSGGGSAPADQYVGTWSGTMDVAAARSAGSRAIDQLGLLIEFQKSSSPSTVLGTLVETKNESIGGVTQAFVQKIGTFTGTVSNTAVTIDGVFHYDANDNPNLNSTVNFHADLAPTRSRALGLSGTWVGNSANGGGFTVIGQPTVPFTLSFTQNAAGTYTAMVINTPPLGAQPFSATLGGTVGNSVTISGYFPANTPKISGVDVSGLKYALTAIVDASGNKMTGSLQVYLAPNAPMQAATFVAFRQVAVAGAPHILVADRNNNRIVSLTDITGAGFTTLGVSGDGTKQFFHPEDVTIDESGKIYIVDSGNSRIVRVNDITGAGWVSFSTIPAGGTFPPHKVHVGSDGKIYWSDATDVHRVDNMSGANPLSLRAQAALPTSSPSGITTDSSGRIYVVFTASNKVVMVDLAANPHTAVSFGSAGGGVNEFDLGFSNGGSGAIDIDAQNRIYVADYNNFRIVRFDNMTGVNNNWTSFDTRTDPSNPNDIHRPTGLVVLPSGGPIFFTDPTQVVSQVNNMQGQGLVRYGTPGSSDGQFNLPQGITYRD